MASLVARSDKNARAALPTTGRIAFVRCCLQVTFVRNQQTDTLKTSAFQIAEKFAPAFLILPTAFRDAENFPIAFPVHSDNHQNRNRLDFPSPGPLEPDTVYKNIRIFLFQRAITPALHTLEYLLIQVADGTRTDTAAPERLGNILNLADGYAGQIHFHKRFSTELSLRR